MRKRGNLFELNALHLFQGLLRIHCGELLAAEGLRWSENPDVGLSPAFIAYSRAFLAEVLLERGELEAARDLVDQPLPELEEGHGPPFAARERASMARVEPARTGARRLPSNRENAARIRDPQSRLGPLAPRERPWRSISSGRSTRLVAGERRARAAEPGVRRGRSGSPFALSDSSRAARPGRSCCETPSACSLGSQRRLDARALVDLGAALRRANRRAARKPLREGIEVGQGCGAVPLVARANAELAATGAHPRTILLSGLDGLTASERRVANMAARELSNKEIAQALFVTVKTVEQHLGRVYRKLDISSRRQLAAALTGRTESVAPTRDADPFSVAAGCQFHRSSARDAYSSTIPWHLGSFPGSIPGAAESGGATGSATRCAFSAIYDTPDPHG